MTKKDESNIISNIIIILLILFTIFLIYQILKKILGGSWSIEDILISLNILVITSLFVIVGFVISMSKTLGKLESNFENIRNSFSNLVHDFKEHLAKEKN